MDQKIQVAVLMPVFKPSVDFLYEQIASIENQKGVEITLCCVVADMVSEEIITNMAAKVGIHLKIFVPQSKLGVTEAIIFGVKSTIDAFEYDYLALCDQDDIWLPTKIKNQINVLKAQDADLTYCDAHVINHNNTKEYGSMHVLEKRPKCPTIYNLATGNIGTGMTFLMTYQFSRTALPFLSKAPKWMLHDYQMMIICSLVGKVYFDERIFVRYRQHGANHTGIAMPKEVVQNFESPAQQQKDEGCLEEYNFSQKKNKWWLISESIISVLRNFSIFVRESHFRARERYCFIMNLEYQIKKRSLLHKNHFVLANLFPWISLFVYSVYKKRRTRARYAIWFIFFILIKPFERS